MATNSDRLPADKTPAHRAQLRNTRKDPFVISTAYDAMLRQVYTYHFLKVSQIMRLGEYSVNSLGWVQNHLRTLTLEKYLLRPKLPHTETGKAPYIYCLAQNGLEYMQDLGYDTSFRFRPGDHKQPTYGYLQHLMGLNDFLITASFLPKVEPPIKLVKMQHEWMLKRRGKVSVQVTSGIDGQTQQKKRTVWPDAWLDYLMPDSTHIPLLIEFDRGTETNKWDFQEKLEALLRYVQGPYEALFDTPLVTIAFATIGGESRRDEMLTWCEQVLHRLEAEKEAQIFYFCALPDGVWDPRQIFLSPFWHRPFDFTETGGNTRSRKKIYNKPLVLLE